jgi:hypothetical protein
MSASQTRHLHALIDAMPQHAARIMDRVAVDAKAHEMRAALADEWKLARIVASCDASVLCQRDVMYAVFEASFADAYGRFYDDTEGESDDDDDDDDSEGESESDDTEGESESESERSDLDGDASDEERGVAQETGAAVRKAEIELGARGVRLTGVVATAGRMIKVGGTFFTSAYVAPDGSYRTALAFMSRARFSVPQNKLKVGHYATFQTRRDAEQVFEAARAAMDVCKRLVGGDAVVYPRVDPIVTYTVQPEDSWSLVECARVHAMPRKLSIECTLDGTYFFGHHAVSKRDMMSGLNRVFENHPGDAAWRARGLIAPNLSAAVERSRGVVGESIVMFIHVFMADEDNAHAVTAALRATRSSTGRLVRAEILLRGSYDDRPDMRALLRRPELRGVRGTVRWVGPLEALENAEWRWRTQGGEGSCNVHAAMLAVKLAQRVVDGDDDVEGAMRERCHVAFGAAALYALSVARSSAAGHAGRTERCTVQADGSVWVELGAETRARDVPSVERELSELGAMRRLTHTLVARCKAAGALRAALVRSGFFAEGPFLRKEYAPADLT